MYIEASNPRKQGDKAWFVSQSFPATTAQCITFWYHMKGSSIGTLKVLLQRQGVPDYVLWRLDGDQGDKWISGQAPISSSSSSYKIVFEGVRGTGYLGDIAIDDISFSSSKCGCK